MDTCSQHHAKRQGYFYAALTVLIWSGFILISRLGRKSVLSAWDIVALRFAPAALILLPFGLRAGLGRYCNLRLLILALLGGVGYSVLVYSGVRFAPAVHASILLPGSLPFGMALMAWLVLGERPSLARWLGLGLIAGGILLLAHEVFSSAGDSLIGDVQLLAASLCWALYTVLIRRWQVSVWDATIGGILIPALLYLPVYGFWLPKHLAEASMATLLIQGVYQGIVVVIVAMIFYLRAAHALGASTTGSLMALVPVISSLAAVPLLGESMTGLMLAGVCLVSAGAWLGNRHWSWAGWGKT